MTENTATKAIRKTCMMCDETTLIELPAEQAEAWETRGRKAAQEVLPALDTVTRETLISGMCRDCQTLYF